MSIYDKTVPKPVLDILAEMIAGDASIPTSRFNGGSGASSQHGVDD
jgi:import receptor subunit TOM20